MIYEKLLELIKQEIEKDPMKRGYAGKTDEEIMALLNSSYSEPVTSYVGHPSPLNRILSGFSGVGNLIGVTEVTEAQKVVLTTKEIL